MDITFSANNREEVMVMPVVQTGIEIDCPQANTSYEGLSKEINIIGNVGLRTITIDSFFVNRKYSFVRPNASTKADDYIAFFEKWRKNKVPIRIVITETNGREFLNMACTIDRFKYAKDKPGDVPFSLTIREYVFVI